MHAHTETLHALNKRQVGDAVANISICKLANVLVAKALHSNQALMLPD